MIVYAKDDIVSLSGNLHRNHWLTIKAAANLILKEHPEGIIIDCEHLTDISQDGIITFYDAFRDIQAADARMLITNLPSPILEQMRCVPGVRSRVPIANSIEEARDSLRSQAETDSEVSNCILVPLFAGIPHKEVVSIGADLAKIYKVPLLFLYCLEVARDLPLGTPLPDIETEGCALIDEATKDASELQVKALAHMERVRDIPEGVLQQAEDHKAIFVVIGLQQAHIDEHKGPHLIEALFERSNCNVIVFCSPSGNYPSRPVRKPTISSRRIRTSGK